ncbi:MAG: DUF4199 domain-containing protein [Bacteroidota bacterium]
MSKKILIYGLAFGSACGALNYIYTASAIYKDSSMMNLFFILLELIIIPGIGIFLFLKSFRDQKPEEFTVGKAVFLGFFVSIMIGCSVSLLISYFIQFKPAFINELINYRINNAKSKGAELHKSQEEINNMIANIKFAYTTSQQFISQLFASAARGLFLSAIFAYILQPKKPKVTN